MDFGPAAFGLGYLAGVLSTLSPCVLPLLPILFASALARHRLGPLALAAGLALSFTVIGLSIATLGTAFGADPIWLRRIAAGSMALFGAVMLVPRLQSRFAASARHWVGSAGGPGRTSRGTGWTGQFAVGSMLGLVWSPCVGPTLGAASTLAAQGRDLTQVAALMLLFGLGAATPLALVGALSQQTTARLRGVLLVAGDRGRRLLGACLLVLGVAIATGADRTIESWAVAHSPDWLTELTTRF